jgi:uncharacterized protein (TIGR00290 family)
MLVVVSWSGGKDSCLALYKAMISGLRVSHLLNFVSREESCMSHGVNSKIIAAQSQAINIPLIQKEVTWDTYEGAFKSTLVELKRMGIEGVVFGDIHIEEHLEWVTRVCGEVNVTPLEPLWGMDTEDVLREFIEAGFEAIVVNVKADLFGDDWLARRIDLSFVEDLKRIKGKRNFDLCGEYGEYHTLVLDGPLFNKRIRILESEKVLREGYWKYWLLNILRWEVEEKGLNNGKNLRYHTVS